MRKCGWWRSLPHTCHVIMFSAFISAVCVGAHNLTLCMYIPWELVGEVSNGREWETVCTNKNSFRKAVCGCEYVYPHGFSFTS